MTVLDNRDTVWHLLASELGVKVVSSATTEVDILHSLMKQHIPKDWRPIVFMADEEPLPVINVDNKRGFDLSDQCVNGWLALIREELYSNPSVEDIFVSIEDSDVDVWVIIPERDISILRQLVEIEGRILEMIVSGEHPPFLIDFHVIYRCGRNTEDLVSNRAIRLPRQVV